MKTLLELHRNFFPNSTDCFKLSELVGNILDVAFKLPTTENCWSVVVDSKLSQKIIAQLEKIPGVTVIGRVI